MKIATKVTVDIDTDAWREEHGTTGSDRDVAAAVREYVTNTGVGPARRRRRAHQSVVPEAEPISLSNNLKAKKD